MAANGNGKERKRIAFVVYPGTPPLDLVGSWQFLGGLAMKKGYELVLVAEGREPVATDTPLQLVPDMTFDSLPHPQGLVVLGGGLASLRAMGSDALLSYLGSAAQTAEFVASVGTGSLLLAAAGALDGREASTHWAYARLLEQLGARYVRRRYVEDGKFISAAGDTAAIDMALYLLEKMGGRPLARFQQLWAEYDPQPPFGSIDWSEVDDNPLPDLLVPHLEDLRRRLGRRPDLIRAIEAAVGADGTDTPLKLENSSPHSRAQTKIISFVLYPGLTVFDLVGPLQVLSRMATLAPEFETTVVAERIEVIESDSLLKFLPDRSFAEIPHPFAFVVPGGGLPTLRAMGNPAIRDYIRTAAQGAEKIGSVCTGALLLASVGLLEGREVPTHWAYKNVLESYGVRYVRKRWVEDGRFVVSAGVSAGIDSGLLLAARLTDRTTARLVQLGMEYEPQPPFGGIDYGRLDRQSRLLKGALSLTAPLFTFRPKRMTRRERRLASIPLATDET